MRWHHHLCGIRLCRHILQPAIQKHSCCFTLAILCMHHVFLCTVMGRSLNSVGKCVLNKELLASVTLNINTAPKCGYSCKSINTHFLFWFFLGENSRVVWRAVCLSFTTVFIHFVIYALLKKLTRKALKVRTVHGKSMKTWEDMKKRTKCASRARRNTREKLTHAD